MPGVQLTCPHCGSTLSFNQAIRAGTVLPCLVCNQTFTIRAATAPAAPAAPAAVERPPAAAAAPVPRTLAVGNPVTTRRPTPPKATVEDAESSGSAGRLFGGILLVGMGLLLLGGLGHLFWTNVLADRFAKTDKQVTPVLLAGTKSPPPVVETKPAEMPPSKNAVEAKKEQKPPIEDDDDVVVLAPKKKPDQPPVLIERKTRPPQEEKPPPPAVEVALPAPPAPPSAPGVDAKRVDGAISQGVSFLKGRQKPDGSWQEGNNQVGYASLCGLALLECQVPADDLAVRKAAYFVRANLTTLNQVYDISAAILFLDRLGDIKDRELIRALGSRLALFQNPAGGWHYKGAVIYAVDLPGLHGYLRTHFPWSKARPKPASSAKLDPKPSANELPAVDLQKLPAGELTWNKWSPFMLSPGDNSNTQFALLALWAARRHDLPVECPILLSYQRFLTTQNDDGGWSYMGPVTLPGFPAPRPIPPGTQIAPGVIPPGFIPAGGLPGLPAGAPGAPAGLPPDGIGVPGGNTTSTATMTCVGLLGLAMGHGAVPAAKANDTAKLENPAIQKALRTLSHSVGNPSADPNARPPMENLYLLWSVERVAMLYDLKTIGGKDWYGWGAQILLANQNASGAWGGGGYESANEVSDTCFALLFLKRSNLVPDLTENLRLHMVIRDPGGR